MSGSPLAAWIGFCPSMTMYPGGKVMTALALLLHEPAWHAAEGYIAAPTTLNSDPLGLTMGIPEFSRLDCKPISAARPVQDTTASAVTSLNPGAYRPGLT
jgi:hypothetical protein